MKKILVTLGTAGTVLTMLPLFAAFEAHVVNVTARIENALAVNSSAIQFGTVFPQEHLNKPLRVELSGSFLDEDRVDDVDYFIRQKPKCGITSREGTVLDEANTATGHVTIGDNPATTDVVETSWIDCGNPPRQLTTGESWGVLPSLCEYISKEPDNRPENDGQMPSFHHPYTIVGNQVIWNDTKGHLAKSQSDTVDNWNIDLAVPCFGGYCAQDWENFVHGINASATPSEFTQPIANEHKVFGCDLWIEVGGISLPGLGCKGKVDLMLVVDRSGSIGSTDMATVRTALNSFIDALVLAVDGPNAGQSSFASIGTLDQVLTSSSTLMHAAIDALLSSGSTDLTSGINLAQAELDSVRDRADAPNIMLVVTDGQPNVGSDPNGEAAAAAAAARADGTEVFVVGIGSGVDPLYLQSSIASAPTSTHYFAGDFTTLQNTLVDLVSCE